MERLGTRLSTYSRHKKLSEANLKLRHALRAGGVIKLRDPTLDASSISTNIQDGRQLNISNQNISRNKADMKFCNRFLYIVLESVSNNNKIFCCHFPLRCVRLINKGLISVKTEMQKYIVHS